jgi:uncharacterized RDD family membrane protein YckC
MLDLKLPKQRKMTTDASKLKRIISFFIDFILIQIIIFGPFSGVIQNKIPVTSNFGENMLFLENNPDIIYELAPVLFAIFLLVFAYFVVFEYFLQTTPGKLIFGLKVVGIQNSKPKLLRLIARNVVVFPVFPFTIFWIADPLYLLFTGQRLIDKFTQIKVIEEIYV